MRTIDRLKSMLGDVPGDTLEVRIRAGRAVQYRRMRGDSFGPVMPAERLPGLLAALADHSLHSRNADLRQGYFTMSDGCRVGACGRLIWDGDRVRGMAEVGSICVRVCREIDGAADGFYDALFEGGRLQSALIVSPPGMGKTTALRAAARRLSEDGYNVCIADERRELAACVGGVPTLDVGTRTDVMDGCPKHIAIMVLLRAASPQVIVTDEIGDVRDAQALSEAARCGASVLASAHAAGFEALNKRKCVSTEVFSIGILLGDVPGRVKEIRRL